MKWFSVKDKLPDTHEQHNLIFSSGQVLVFGSEGYEIDQYLRHYEDRGGLVLIKEGWMSSDDVVSWSYLKPPIK